MKRILIVDNDVETMFLLKAWLEKRSYEVSYTSNLEEIRALVNQFRPHLMIVDITEDHLIEQVRNIPVILMTGYAKRKVNKCFPAAATIEKPFNLPLLERKIENLVYARRA